MIVGSHSVIYSKAPGKDRAFLRDVLKLPVVDGGGGYLIFGLPSAEASIHETSTEGSIQELYLLCDDIETFISDMKSHSISCRSAGRGLGFDYRDNLADPDWAACI